MRQLKLIYWPRNSDFKGGRAMVPVQETCMQNLSTEALCISLYNNNKKWCLLPTQVLGELNKVNTAENIFF